MNRDEIAKAVVKLLLWAAALALFVYAFRSIWDGGFNALPWAFLAFVAGLALALTSGDLGPVRFKRDE